MKIIYCMLGIIFLDMQGNMLIKEFILCQSVFNSLKYMDMTVLRSFCIFLLKLDLNTVLVWLHTYMPFIDSLFRAGRLSVMMKIWRWPISAVDWPSGVALSRGEWCQEVVSHLLPHTWARLRPTFGEVAHGSYCRLFSLSVISSRHWDYWQSLEHPKTSCTLRHIKEWKYELLSCCKLQMTHQAYFERGSKKILAVSISASPLTSKTISPSTICVPDKLVRSWGLAWEPGQAFNLLGTWVCQQCCGGYVCGGCEGV